jgi:hypothetical protein
MLPLREEEAPMSKPLRKQLQDPIFRKWMAKAPRNREGHENWRVYVQKKKKGRWYKLKRDFATYKEAYLWVMKHLGDYHDIALSSKVWQYWPPRNARGRTVLPEMKPHDEWCTFCRRITSFKYFKRHHNIQPWFVDPGMRYCEICGARYVYAVAGASRRFGTRHIRHMKPIE